MFVARISVFNVAQKVAGWSTVQPCLNFSQRSAVPSGPLIAVICVRFLSEQGVTATVRGLQGQRAQQLDKCLIMTFAFVCFDIETIISFRLE